jgi:hypothetical protein
VIFRRSNSRFLRTLRVALCYVVAMQAFLAAFGTTMAAARATVFDPLLVICHSGDSGQPSNGDTRNPEKLPCIVCAAAAAAPGLESNPAPLAAIHFVIAGRVSSARATVVAHHPPSRAGHSRAPPSYA